jgi:hypothetical protein
LKRTFREGASVEGSSYGGWRGGGEDLGRDGGVLEVVEGEAGAVGDGVVDWSEVAGSNAGLEDQVLVRLRDAVAIVEDRENPVAATFQRRGDADIAGAGVAGVA